MAGHEWGRLGCACGAWSSVWSTPRSPESAWTFRLIITGVGLTDPELDALFEAGCDDAMFTKERDGSVLALFDREDETPEAAVVSAIVDIEATAGIGARVVKVVVEDDWLTAAEVAERLGRSRQSIGQLVRGVRGPGGL